LPLVFHSSFLDACVSIDCLQLRESLGDDVEIVVFEKEAFAGGFVSSPFLLLLSLLNLSRHPLLVFFLFSSSSLPLLSLVE
jgi:hypothetical protein